MYCTIEQADICLPDFCQRAYEASIPLAEYEDGRDVRDALQAQADGEPEFAGVEDWTVAHSDAWRAALAESVDDALADFISDAWRDSMLDAGIDPADFADDEDALEEASEMLSPVYVYFSVTFWDDEDDEDDQEAEADDTPATVRALAESFGSADRYDEGDGAMFVFGAHR